ncbi:uncharacterized protein LOC121770305 [Salvia splendens]|uniref:uncharacterized protein LOC121770305 n=1 Tax=Salvia splendens TaxID=180675 RepID=UPI001C2584D8|nr:uncharacterized protein LOC121770305 [Salvia splendens]
MQIAPALIAFSLDFFDASSICISSFSAHELALLQISSETISSNDLKRVNGKLLLANPQSQRIEIEHYLNTQNHRLRIALYERRRRQTALLVRSYDSKIQSLPKQSDDEISRAGGGKWTWRNG